MRIDQLLALFIAVALTFTLGCPTDDDDSAGDDDTTVADDDDATSDDDDTTPTEIEGDEAGECDDGVDNDQDGVTDCDDDGCAAATGCEDADGDGWVVQDGDCDDLDETVHPGADEGCDGIDTDCDGVPSDEEIDDDSDGAAECEGDCDDTDPELNIDDADGDGVDTCSDDCDDEDDTSYPGASEVCDDIDNDCNGTPDDGLAFDTYYPDADSDLHGDASDAGEYTCDPQAGWVADNSDCDDSDDTVYAGAAELCDAIDNDCDGSADAAEVDGDLDGFMICEDDCDDDDSAIYPGATEDCNGVDDDCDGTVPADEDDADADGVRICAGDCDDSDAANFPGNNEICDGQDNDCDGVATANEVDADGDGFMVCEGDCDDADSSRHPGATEVCEGLDTDCDGVLPVDENDYDGDGWMGCEECDDDDATMHPDDDDGDGFSPCDGDCDDGEASAYPGGIEICDDIDNNCDGSLSATEVDDDGDGSMVCEGDCDDGDATVYPGAAEVCDGVDNNCNGTIPADEDDADGDGWMVCENDCDDGDAAVHEGAPDVCDAHLDNDCDGQTDPLEADDDGDGATECGDDCDDTDVGLNVQDVDGDGWTTCDGDCDDGDADANPGETEVCGDGIDNDCDGLESGCGPMGTIDLSLADAKLLGEANDDRAAHWRGLWRAGDIDNDGYDDILVGAAYNDDGGNRAGKAYVIYGPVYGTLDLSAADAELIGVAASDLAGYAVAGGGDVDADGFGDFIVGAHASNAGGTDSGAAYMFNGPVYGTLSLSVADATFVGEDADDNAGIAVRLDGDVDSNGYDDVLIGAYHADDGGADSGAAYLFYGPVTGTNDLSTADVHFVGENASDAAGFGIALSGDADADGNADILIGAHGSDAGGSASGAAYLFHGPVSGTIDLSAADTTFVGENADDYAGWATEFIDANGDGLDDLLIAAYGNEEGGSSAGAVYLVNSPVSGTVDLSAADGKFYGEDAEDDAGKALISAGDIDGDGMDDLLIGANEANEGGGNSGVTYLLYGPLSGTLDLVNADAIFVGESADDHSGYNIGAGDLDGDGLDDILIAAGYDDEAVNNAGAAYIFYAAE